jgi:hypothetical protein
MHWLTAHTLRTEQTSRGIRAISRRFRAVRLAIGSDPTIADAICDRLVHKPLPTPFRIVVAWAFRAVTPNRQAFAEPFFPKHKLALGSRAATLRHAPAQDAR